MLFTNNSPIFRTNSVFKGILMVILGVFLVCHVQSIPIYLAILAGIFMLLSGLTILPLAWMPSMFFPRVKVTTFVMSALLILGGIALLSAKAWTKIEIAMLMAVVSGIWMIVGAIQNLFYIMVAVHPVPLVLDSALSILLGVACCVSPLLCVTVYGWMIGIAFIIDGVVSLIVSMRKLV